ncbi:phosphohydrolase [Chitinispirillum alkaliphilum]|nr:phosphohydrolase [Chitinispirillum alkaliphilum]
MKDVIEGHKENQNYQINTKDIADLLTGGSKSRHISVWRTIITSQLDADRADYLLRDSHHIGVAYGKFDLSRILTTLRLELDENGSPKLAIEDGGVHAAEALILARYMMFTQVYFQHTRRAYDNHLVLTMKELLNSAYRSSKAVFPKPDTAKRVKEYLTWNDWKVLGMIATGKGGEHAEIIKTRKHYRKVYETSESPSVEELDKVKSIEEKFRDKIGFTDMARGSPYKFEKSDIPIYITQDESMVKLSEVSTVIKGLRSINQYRVYSPLEHRNIIQNEIKQ